jgi:iron-regulated transporter 1
MKTKFDEIQRELANEPYQYPSRLYTMHFFFAFTARMWDMGIILLLADLTDNSIAMAAFAGLLCNLALVLFMSSLGSFLDKSNRLDAARITLGAKFLTLTTAYIVCAVLTYQKNQNIPFNYYYIYSIPVLSAIASLSFSTISQSVEKDWIVVLSNHNSSWLSSTNSIMTQIDALCNAVAPGVTGFLFMFFTQSQSAVILLLINALSTIGLYVYMAGLYDSWPSLAHRQERPKVATNTSISSTTSNSNSTHTHVPHPDSHADHCGCRSGYCCFDLIHTHFHDFLHSGCAGIMFAYAMLYMTVLSFGSLMTVYLRWSGMSDHWIGIARGTNALSGFVGATIFPALIASYGLYPATTFSIVYQWAFVTIAAASFFFFSQHIIIVLLSVCVVSLLAVLIL